MDPLEQANQALDRAIDTERRNKLFIESIGPAIVNSLAPVIAESLKVLELTEDRNKIFMESIGPSIVNSIRPVIQESIKNIGVNVKQIIPEIKQPIVNVAAPIVNVPESVVNVTVPPIKIPPIKVPRSDVKVTMATKELTNEVKKVTQAIKAQPIPIFNTPDYTFKQPIPAIMVDAKGKPMDLGGGQRVDIKKGLHLDLYDYVSLVQSDNQDIYTFKRGGSNGNATAGITILYADATRATILSVTKS